MLDIYLHSHIDTDVEQITREYKMLSYLQHDDQTDNDRFIFGGAGRKEVVELNTQTKCVICVINIQH